MAETRKLAAILAADVVGYSRLIGEDEAGTARAGITENLTTELSRIRKSFVIARNFSRPAALAAGHQNRLDTP